MSQRVNAIWRVLRLEALYPGLADTTEISQPVRVKWGKGQFRAGQHVKKWRTTAGRVPTQ